MDTQHNYWHTEECGTISNVRLIKLGSYCSNFLEKLKINVYFNCVKPYLAMKELLTTAKIAGKDGLCLCSHTPPAYWFRKKQKQTKKPHCIYKEKFPLPERVSLKQFCPVG